ncbi:MAG: hypothetical protein Q8Q82_13845 [Hydrogenophaga sp.]|nr:hypothetical protein [Hydrogenophaga sp.]
MADFESTQIAVDLMIHIWPRCHDAWFGTKEQLIESGVIPADFEWPVRTSWKQFTHEGIDCSIQRQRQPGRKTRWVDVDHWRLVRYCHGRASGDPELYEKTEEVKRLKWLQSHEGQREIDRSWQARRDPAYQAFRQVLLASIT